MNYINIYKFVHLLITLLVNQEQQVQLFWFNKSMVSKEKAVVLYMYLPSIIPITKKYFLLPYIEKPNHLADTGAS